MASNSELNLEKAEVNRYSPSDSPIEAANQQHTPSSKNSPAIEKPTYPSCTISRLRLRNPRPPFTHPLSNEKSPPESVVDFEGPDDPYRPMNWSPHKKLSTLGLYGLVAMSATFNSAIFSAASAQVSSDFNVSTIVTSLATTMVLLGFGLGPLLWGPLSEVYGRKYVVFIPYFIATFFAFGCGASANIQTILITRFFQGAFSASVITNTGGMLADIYAPKERGTALVVYSLSIVGGPLLAPIIGSAIVTSHLRWRWTMYIVGIFQMVVATLAVIMVDETYAPILLVRKAQQLRYETGNWALHAQHEEWNVSVKELGRKYLIRPWQLLANPICALMCFYASFVYGLIYGSLFAIPMVFEKGRGWSPVVGSLPFIALLLGCVIGLLSNTLNQKIYAQAMDKNGGKPVPEARLYPMMFGGFALSAGMFIFAWTGTRDVTWVAPCIGIVLIGAGFFPIFQASFNYVVDTFLPMAASAVAAMTFVRSVFGATFPIFLGPMLDSLGADWGLSLLGFVGVAMLPVPFLFFTYGKQLRAKGRLSAESC